MNHHACREDLWYSRGRAALLIALVALAPALPAAADPPAPPWTVKDIGSPAAAGATEVDADGLWTLRGNGRGIADSADHFHFAYQAVKGDASITARFLGLEGTRAEQTRVGLMVRETDSPGSPNLTYAMTPARGLVATSRLERNRPTGSLNQVGPGARPEPNLYLRLQRVGQEVAGFYSRDGQLWVQADFPPQSLPTLSEEVLLGLAVTSARNNAITTGRFDQVRVEPGMVSVYGLQACGGDRAVLLQWRPLKEAVAYNIYRGPGDATQDRLVKVNAEPVRGSSFTDSGAGLVNGTPQTYAVAAVWQGADGEPVEGPRAVVRATPVGVPAGWLGCSVAEGGQGSVLYDAATGEITLRGGGGFWWPGPAQLYFVGELVEGDVQVTVKLLTRPTFRAIGTSAALHFLEALEPGARVAALGDVRDYGIGFWWRGRTDGLGSVVWESAGDTPRLPVKLRLTRQGNRITAETSTDDGRTYTALRPPVTFNPPLAKTLYVGLAIMAQDRGGITEAKFSNLEIKKL